jgi:hypothetical protein
MNSYIFLFFVVPSQDAHVLFAVNSPSLAQATRGEPENIRLAGPEWKPHTPGGSRSLTYQVCRFG